jgi:bacillithiol biosynthesis cysteine-adding enzyme BshC
MSLRLISVPPGGPVRLAPRDAAPATPTLQPSPAADRLALPGALAVTTGQQPGLFGGPMFVLHKALAARALAARLEAEWQRPVIPVFWLAGDDHDHDEATRTAWWSTEGEVVPWALPPRPRDAPQLPMSREPLGREIAAARDRLAADLPHGPARDEALAWIDRHWRPEATVHGAFRDALQELLTPLGIAMLDATAPAFKREQAPLLRAALARARELDSALAALPEDQGRADAGQGLTLVFLEASAGRDRLVAEDDGFRTRRSNERFSAAAIDRLLSEAPERFSANVLLRPVVEAALLPTVAYVAGPGEYRYLTTQARVLYPFLGIAPQCPVPRWGGTVVDAVSERLLGRLGIDGEQVLADDGRLGRELLRQELPAAFTEALEGLRGAIDHAAGAAQHAGEAIDAVLPRAVESRRRRLQFVAEDLERVMLRHLRKRDDIAWRQYQRLRARLRPLDAPQERVIGVAGALGTWGNAWIEAAAGAADDWASAVLEAGAEAEVRP